MRKAMRAGLGLLLVVAGVAGCADRAATSPVTISQQECERSGGTWRSAHCERSGGGGY